MNPLWIGFAGSGLILFAFVMGQLHQWKDTYFIYDFLNFIGALGLVVFALQTKSWPFFLLNSVWTLVSLRDCVLDIRRNAHEKSDKFWRKWMH